MSFNLRRKPRWIQARWIAGVVFLLLAGRAAAQDSTTLKTPKDKRSYSIGIEFAASLKGQGIDIDPDLLVQGFKDALSGAKPLMTEDDIRATLTALQDDMKEKQMQAMIAAAAENQKAGDAFLGDNGKKDGVVTLPSGLQYKILKAGDGKKPAATDTVMCIYAGKLLDGTEFDSSAGKAVPFDVKGVIPGFSEALQLMPVGSQWQLFIPANLAYGARGAGDTIGPNTALIFTVELVSIQ